MLNKLDLDTHWSQLPQLQDSEMADAIGRGLNRTQVAFKRAFISAGVKTSNSDTFIEFHNAYGGRYTDIYPPDTQVEAKVMTLERAGKAFQEVGFLITTDSGQFFSFGPGLLGAANEKYRQQTGQEPSQARKELFSLKGIQNYLDQLAESQANYTPPTNETEQTDINQVLGLKLLRQEPLHSPSTAPRGTNSDGGSDDPQVLESSLTGRKNKHPTSRNVPRNTRLLFNTIPPNSPTVENARENDKDRSDDAPTQSGSNQEQFSTISSADPLDSNYDFTDANRFDFRAVTGQPQTPKKSAAESSPASERSTHTTPNTPLAKASPLPNNENPVQPPLWRRIGSAILKFVEDIRQSFAETYSEFSLYGEYAQIFNEPPSPSTSTDSQERPQNRKQQESEPSRASKEVGTLLPEELSPATPAKQPNRQDNKAEQCAKRIFKYLETLRSAQIPNRQDYEQFNLNGKDIKFESQGTALTVTEGNETLLKANQTAAGALTVEHHLLNPEHTATFKRLPQKEATLWPHVFVQRLQKLQPQQFKQQSTRSELPLSSNHTLTIAPFDDLDLAHLSNAEEGRHVSIREGETVSFRATTGPVVPQVNENTFSSEEWRSLVDAIPFAQTNIDARETRQETQSKASQPRGKTRKNPKDPKEMTPGE
jgi:hypothetical protein